MLEILSKQDQLWRIYALKICGCKDKADDLVQEMYIKLHNHKGQITKRLVYLTINCIFKDGLKKKRIETVQLQYNNTIHETDELDRRLEALDLLKNLSFFEKEVLLLTHEKSLREAEKETRVPYYVLNYHKKKALKKLKKYGRRTG